MGFLSNIFKGLKKFVKKIGKGIKKVARKIGKAVNKLGIVGQIGMMILMPYAAGAMSSFFGATGTLSSWGTTLLGKSGIASKALGHTLNAINTVGTMAGQVYTGVTETIGKAWDVVSGKGTIADVGKSIKGTFTDTADALKLMDPKYIAQQQTEKAAFKATIQEGFKLELEKADSPYKLGRSPEEVMADQLDKSFPKDTNSMNNILENYEKVKPKTLQESITAFGKGDPSVLSLGRSPEEVMADQLDKSFPKGETLLGPTKDAAAAYTQTATTGPTKILIPDQAASPIEKLEDIFKKGWEDAKVDLKEKAIGKVKDTITRKGMELMGIEEESFQRQQGQEAGSYNLPPQLARTDSGIDFINSYVVDSFAKQGNNHLAYSIANLGHISSMFDPNNNPTTDSFMTDYYLAPNITRQLGAA